MNRWTISDGQADHSDGRMGGRTDGWTGEPFDKLIDWFIFRVIFLKN